MSKKHKKPKKESPWKDIPVTTYEELHPKAGRSKEEKAALQLRKKKVNDSLALQRMSRTNHGFRQSPTSGKKAPKHVQLVPIQTLVEVGTDKDTGEKVFAKVKTNKFKVINHAANNSNGTKHEGSAGELVPSADKRDLLTPRESVGPDIGPVPEDTGTEAGERVQSVPVDPAQ